MENEGQQSTTAAKTENSRPVVNVQVNAVAEDDGNAIAFRLEAGNSQSEPYVTGPTSLSFPNGEALYKVHFHVKDSNCSYNLKFDRDTPIRAHDGNCCPTSGGIETNELERKERKDRLLVIDNYNSVTGPVGFALQFVDKVSDEPLEPFDPIMDNGGGGIPKRL